MGRKKAQWIIKRVNVKVKRNTTFQRNPNVGKNQMWITEGYQGNKRRIYHDIQSAFESMDKAGGLHYIEQCKDTWGTFFVVTRRKRRK